MRVASLLNLRLFGGPMQSGRCLLQATKQLLGASLLMFVMHPTWAADSATGDTSSTSHEIQFCSGQSAPYANCAAADLRIKADALASPVAIFEYMRNNYEFALYHGARSGSINSFSGGRGNDVDLAATLISMLRSQGYPARYVVGTIKAPSANVANWLQVNDTSLSTFLLKLMGTQAVSQAGSTTTFEHVWVEVQVPYNNYRGVGGAGVNCVSTPSSCNWVPLDPSFKLHIKQASGLDPYSALSFDYNAYYAAIKNNDPIRRDKNPLEIYQNQVIDWLKTSAPGKTLVDIADFKGIKVEQFGLLPASLPYALAGSSSSVRRYNSVADHDAAVTSGVEAVKWGKSITAQVQIGGGVVGSATVSLVDAATQRLTLSFAPLNSGYSGGFSLNGVAQGTSVNSTGAATLNGQPMTIGTPLKIIVTMDGIPAADASTPAQNISATYDGSIGGYYLVATGGETSNWGQVHASAAQLLTANSQNLIVYNPADPGIDTNLNGVTTHLACDPTSGLNCIPYVDANNSGSWDSSDPKLLNSKTVLEPLTGGLLQVAAQQYFTKFREGIAQLDSLNRIRTPIAGFLGVLSSTNSAQYLDSTAFSIEPGGLLIDMRGVLFGGAWRIDQSATQVDSQFELVGHIGSSLEHEIWQELTGFDSISTTRGIQLALAKNASLTNFYRNSSADTFSTGYSAFGFDVNAPSGFVRHTYNLFGQNYLSWSNSNQSAAFEAIYSNSQGIPAGDVRLATFTYFANNGLDAFYNSYANLVGLINSWQADVGKIKTNIVNNVSSSNFNTYDIVSVGNVPTGWSVSATRKDASSYNLSTSETTSHADGNYTVPVTSYFSPKDNYLNLGTASFGSNVTVTNTVSDNTAINVVFSQPNSQSVTFRATPNQVLPDGSYPFGFYMFVSGSVIGNHITGFTLQVIGGQGRVTDSNTVFSLPVTISNQHVINCAGNTYTAVPSTLMTNLQGCFNSDIAGKSDFIKFFSPTASFLYRASPAATDSRLSPTVAGMRDNLYQTDTSVNWYTYTSPTKQSSGSSFQFEVDYFKMMDSANGHIKSGTFSIHNSQLTAGGGYVTANAPLEPSSSIDFFSYNGSNQPVSTAPIFINSYLTNLDTIGSVNNDWFKAPLTSDPVSTVTGNNVHDETDFTIKGRAGLNFAFTRTYNSAPSSTTVNNAGLGYGWTHSYAMQLKSKDYGACPNCSASQAPENVDNKTSAITYTDERGGDHNYLVSSTGTISSPAGEFDKLEFNTPAVGQHTLTFRNGNKYIFETVDAAGSPNTTSTYYLHVVPGVTARLKQIVDAWGNQLNFSYTGKRLTGVTDNLGITGRTGLTLAYSSNGMLSTIKDWSGRTWTYVVNTAGNLQSYTSAQAPSSGVTRSYGYASGASNPHFLQTISKPLTRNGKTVKTTFSYYQNGRTFNYQDALGNVETLDYDLYRKSTRVTDPRGGIREYEYDAAGRLTQLTEPDGAVLQFQNTATDGLRYSKTDGLGYQTQYNYHSTPGSNPFNSSSDTYGNVTREQDALSNTVDTTYGPYDQVASIKDKRGNKINTSFHTATDTSCKLNGKPDTVSIASLTVSSGIVKTNVPLVSYCWNGDGTIKSKTEYLDPNNSAHIRVSTFTYTDATHFLLDNVATVGWDDTGGSTTTTKSYTYDTNNLGRVKTETVKRRNSPSDATKVSLTTTYTYDNDDRVTQVQDPVGNLAINNFDDNGQLWRVTHKYLRTDATYDIRNIVSRTFDAADRVSTETDAAGGVTAFTYDQAGNVIAVKDAESHTTNYEYDAMNRRTAVIDANGNRTSTAYNLRGDVVSITNAMGEVTSFLYDSLGRKTQVTDPHGYVTNYTSYDANGNLTCIIDANAQAGLQQKNVNGCTELRSYDELNRVTLIRDALNGDTSTTYDLLNHPITQTDAEGHQYVWAYDGLGRLASETDYSGKSNIYASDEVGNVWQKTNRLGEVTQISFDKLNRATNVLFKKDNSTETTSYDPAGTIHSVSNASVASNITYTFGYDNLKRLLSKADSRGRSLTFTYDKTGNVLTKTTYQGSTTSYTYDGANRLVNVSNPDYLSVNYQYDAAGRLLSRVMSSGARSLYTYDNGGWLNSLIHYDAGGAIVSSQSYGRDRLGHTTTMTTGAGATNYTLDALYRLTTVDAPGAANDQAFDYDKVGNRIHVTKGSTSANSNTRYYQYATGTNRLINTRLVSATGASESSFFYDDEGRLTSQTGLGAKTVAWDAKGRVASVTIGTTTEKYAYDPMDRRIKRTGGSLGNLDYFLEGDHLESVYSGSTLQEKYFRGSTIDELVAGYIYQSGTLTPFMFQHDQVMSVMATTIPNGGVQNTQTNWAFGETQSATGTAVSRLQYTGRENDGTGLYQYRARSYDPAIGRFISEDSKGFVAGINFYAYCNNSPLDCNDPSGNYADVKVNGNNISISIPIQFTGISASQRNINNYIGDIEGQWNGSVNMGGQTYNVVTTVKQLGTFESLFTPDSKKNVVSITAYSPSVGFTATTSCSSGGACTGEWPAKMSSIPGVGGHEAGHLMFLSDQNVILGGRSVALPGMERDIMSQTTGSMTGADIQGIVNNSNSNWSKPGTGPWNQSANGGAFILYPSSPSNNGTQTVYHK